MRGAEAGGRGCKSLSPGRPGRGGRACPRILASEQLRGWSAPAAGGLTFPRGLFPGVCCLPCALAGGQVALGVRRSRSSAAETLSHQLRVIPTGKMETNDAFLVP